MLKLRVFQIFDSKAAAFLAPFFLPEVGVAVRTFSDCCNDKAHAFGRHPADYTLFLLGQWDQVSGVFDLFPSMTAVVNGLQLVKPDDFDIQKQAGLPLGNGDVPVSLRDG